MAQPLNKVRADAGQVAAWKELWRLLFAPKPKKGAQK